MAGDAETGICIMQMAAGLDTGPVLLRRATPIGAEETAGALADRLAGMGAAMIVAALGRIDALVPAPQPEDGATYARKIDKAEARIDWTQPAAAVSAHIRGLSPVPGAWAEANETRLKLLEARVAPGSGAPGVVIAAPLTVACGVGAVEIARAQRPGRGPMPTDELVRGFPLPLGLCLDYANGH
jgi:methionyl-tRNA formyltransferase